MDKETKITLTLTGSPVNITELEISQDMAARIVRLVMPLGSEDAQVYEIREQITAEGTGAQAGDISPKQFMAQKQPKSDMERITCLAYYLTHHQGIESFKTVELTHLNALAAQPRFSNASFTARNAVGQQYLALLGGGKKQITSRGEAVVRAMPDRNAVKAALEANPAAGKKRKLTPKKGKRKA